MPVRLLQRILFQFIEVGRASRGQTMDTERLRLESKRVNVIIDWKKVSL